MNAAEHGKPDYARIAQLEVELFPEEFTTPDSLRHVRKGVWSEAEKLAESAASQNRVFSHQEAERWEQLNRQLDEIDRAIARQLGYRGP